MALIRTIEQLKPFLPIAYANGVKSMPAFDNAEERYIKPVIGLTLYEELHAALAAGTFSDLQTALLSRCRAVIAPLAYLSNLPFIQTLLTDNGLIALETENSRKAFKWEYNEVRHALEDRGFAAQEALISYLRANIGDFAAWQTAPYNDPAGFGIIRFGEDLSTVIGLQYPQRTYGLLKSLLRMVEDLYLIPNLGRNFYAVLNAKVLASQFSGEESELLRLLRPAVARWTMAVAATELGVRFGENGFTVTEGRIKDNADEGRVAASDAQLRRLTDQMSSTGDHYLSLAIDYLNRTATDQIFPEWWISNLYVNPTAPIGPRRHNDERRGFFVAG